MTVFLIIGTLGLALLLLSLIIGEIIGDLLGDLVGDVIGGGWLSTPTIGAFLAAFGYGAALIRYSTDVGAGVAALGGLASGLAVGGLAGVISNSLMKMPTDATPDIKQMTGATGTVITKIPAGGLGEVSVNYGGQLLKLSARSSEARESGVPIVVVAVVSPTSVVVEPSEK